jgi:hypothetical protein
MTEKEGEGHRKMERDRKDGNSERQIKGEKDRKGERVKE